jgi:hypothetical protein
MENMMNLNNDQIWTLVIGVLFAISEMLGMVKKGPNGILHAVWKFYNLKVEIEYEEGGEGMDVVHETTLPNRESIVMNGNDIGNRNISPNVVLVGNVAST